MAERSPTRGLQTRSVLTRAGAVLRAYRGTLAPLLLFALSAWLAFTWFETLQRTMRYYTPLPVWDYWRTAAFLPLYQAFDFGVLWRQHNDHRIVFPELVFAADYLLLHGRQLLPLSISFLCYLGNWIVLGWAFGSDDSVARPVRSIGILLAGIIIGWQGSAAVLADTFLLQWTLLQFAVLLSLAFLARLKETAATADLIAVIACAVVATYSSANGVMLWPILLAAAWLLSVGKRQVIAIGIAAALSIGAYFIGYHFTGNSSIGNLFRHPLYSIEFIGAYLSMPLGAIKSTEFGVLVGLISLGIVILLAITAVRKPLLVSRAGVVLFGSYIFLLLTAVLTAAGRMDPSDRIFFAAKATRYLAVPLISWGVFILLCLWLSSRLHWRFAAPYAIALVVAVLLLLGLPKLRWWLQGSDQDRAKAQLAALAIELGLQDGGVDLGVFLDSQSVSVWAAGLRKNDLSVFYQAHSKWLGHAAGGFAPLRESVVPGEITYTFPVLNGVEVAGWADESELRRRTGWILLVNENGQIAGFGRKLPAGFPGFFDNPRTPPALGWAGFINLSYATKYFSAYVIDRRGLFPIQGSAPVPEVQVIAWQTAGPQIQGIGWQMDPKWTPNNLPPHAALGQGPSGPIYGSWSGDDRNTGRIMSSVFPAPANGCLVLPVLQGPRAGGLSTSLMDSDTNQILASVPFQNTAKQWVFWRLPFPPSVRHLRIVAEDKGKDWGEWLAIGNPSQCK